MDELIEGDVKTLALSLPRPLALPLPLTLTIKVDELMEGDVSLESFFDTLDARVTAKVWVMRIRGSGLGVRGEGFGVWVRGSGLG